MSWTDELYKVYENNCGRTDCKERMLPISHSTANAQIELSIDEHGSFKTAVTVDKSDAETIIPVTNDSSARSSGICPHPFADKLVYLAGDYADFSLSKNADNSRFFEAYINQLRNWAESEFTHKAVNAMYEYLSKGTLMQDLVACGVLITDVDTGKLKDKEKIAGILQDDCFVRFRVYYDDIERDTATWTDKTLYDSFISYNSHTLGDVQLCYATGKVLPSTYKHPSKIRNAGDKAKLISANDESGFSYRGRFCNKEQAISVSYDFSQKMHNALKWLINIQGVNIENSLMLIVWESAELDTVSPLVSASDAMGLDFDNEDEVLPDTFPLFREQLEKSIFGRQMQLTPERKTMVMGLDSATTGRLSMVIYSELASSDFLENLKQWHISTAWSRFSGKLKKSYINSFSLREIIECAFGTEQGNFIKAKPEVVTDYMCRLIPCVTERRKLPEDIVSALVIKASNPLAYSQYYNWQKVLETACGMIRKKESEKGVKYEMALDKNNKNRSYLYGRLLAVADKAENDAYDAEDKGKRITNAKRYMNRFSTRPYLTWNIIEERLEPYLEKLGGTFYRSLINEIMEKFTFGEFTDDRKLEPCYLLGYHHQMQELYTSKKKEEE